MKSHSLERKPRHMWITLLIIATVSLMLSGCTAISTNPASEITLQVAEGESTDLSNGLQIVLLLTALALIPALLILMTGFVRIVVVLSVVRSAIGIPQLPPNQVIIGLALVLTFFVMSPIWAQVNAEAVQPYLAGQRTMPEAIEASLTPLRQFMFKQVRESDLALFLTMGGLPRPNTPDDVPTHVLVPAFAISELRTAFQMAFVIYVPFLVIDMVVSSVLLSMGMMMLPPTVVSLPFKLLLFVLVDGWRLLAESLVRSFA